MWELRTLQTRNGPSSHGWWGSLLLPFCMAPLGAEPRTSLVLLVLWGRSLQGRSSKSMLSCPLWVGPMVWVLEPMGLSLLLQLVKSATRPAAWPSRCRALAGVLAAKVVVCP